MTYDFSKGNDRAVIVCAAIRFGDITLAGARHWDSVMRTQAKVISMDILRASGTEEQGFIDQFGNFYQREEAFKHVQKVGQPIDIERNGGIGALFSEGLY